MGEIMCKMRCFIILDGRVVVIFDEPDDCARIGAKDNKKLTDKIYLGVCQFLTA